MKRWQVAVIFVTACGLSAATGYWFGFREAWHLSVAADFLPRGVIATIELKALRAEKPKDAFTLLEFDVDNGLLVGDQLFTHPLRNFLKPIWGFSGVYPESEKYATRIANYRKEYPSLMKPDMFDTVPPDKEQYRDLYKEMAQGAKENTAKINSMVEKYATKR